MTGPAADAGRPRAELRAAGVARAFAGVQALDDVSLRVGRHEVVGLIGPNGAGKTTLINVLTGFDLPDRGRVELDEHDVTRWRPARRARAGLARTFQHARLFEGLPVRENVEVAALGVGARPRAARERAANLLATLGLEPRADLPAGVLSTGERQKLGVARALATGPRYVLLDEPAAGLSDAEVPALARAIREVRDRHRVGVLLVDHNMALVMDVCDRIHVLDQGRSLAEGTSAEIRGNIDVTAAYLGVGGG
jgi:branched-chain amino acid transport system ATP-binding protein